MWVFLVVIGGAISLALYYRACYLAERKMAKLEHDNMVEFRETASVLHNHLKQERLRNDALMKTNFELAQANECMQGQIQRFRSLPAWSQTIVFN